MIEFYVYCCSNNNYYFIFLTMALRGAVGFKLVFVDSMGSIRDNAISTSRTLLTVCPNYSDGWLRTWKHCPSIWKSLLDIVSRYSDQYQSVGIDKKKQLDSWSHSLQELTKNYWMIKFSNRYLGYAGITVWEKLAIRKVQPSVNFVKNYFTYPRFFFEKRPYRIRNFEPHSVGAW